MVEGLEEVETFAAVFAVDAGFVFVDEGDGAAAEVIEFGVEAAEDFVAVGGRGFVIAEEADERGVEEFGEFDGDFEAVEMGGPGVGEFDLADGRADGGDGQPVVGEFGFDFAAQGGVEVEDIFAGDAAEFEVADATFAADGDLFVEVG